MSTERISEIKKKLYDPVEAWTEGVGYWHNIAEELLDEIDRLQKEAQQEHSGPCDGNGICEKCLILENDHYINVFKECKVLRALIDEAIPFMQDRFLDLATRAIYGIERDHAESWLTRAKNVLK